ncbi:MAG TPA: SDR family oxidoreductase [Candidatus Nitrosocosmicus sp.]|nr:SDR family oxidoreductase [Candidatus Nitrosocosmicus sp.]
MSIIGKSKVALVTGSSTGIGYETCLALARNGFTTCATMRDSKKSSDLERIAKKENLQIKIFEMNVDKDNSVRNTIKKITMEFGKIDILVNNAGYGLFGAFEDFSIDEIKNQFETNVFGVMRVIHKVLPTMRQQKSGIIINISSISGLAGVPTQSAYCATKFAIEGLTEALSFELESFGIKLILIEPGVINTEFVKDLVVPANKYTVDKNMKLLNPSHPSEMKKSSSFYSDTVDKFLFFYYNAMSHAPYPHIVADKIIDAIDNLYNKGDKAVLFRITVGEDSKQYSKLKKKLSDTDFHELLKKNLLK